LTEAFLTLDLGTTRFKVALFDREGHLLLQVAERHKDYVIGRDRWQSADEWWNTAIQLIGEIQKTWRSANSGNLRILACSLSGRAGAGVFLDNTGKVICQPWSDNRHSAQLRAILDTNRSKQKAIPLYAATLAAKLLWARENQSQMAKQTRHLLYAKDFLLYRLTGKTLTDWSSGPDSPIWPEEVLNSLGDDGNLLPVPALPWQIAGEISAHAASQTGLQAGIPVVVGAHDGICANTGAGAITPGQYALTLGTHAVVRTVCSAFPAEANRFYSFPPDLHVIGGNALFAGRALDWFIDNWLSTNDTDRQTLFAELNQDAGNTPTGANGVRFFPYLGGQIAPVIRQNARAVFTGLNTHSTRIDMYRAVLEGTACALSEVYGQVKAWTGKPDSISVTGSGAASSTWIRIIANLLQEPLRISDGSAEGRGAALFASLALGYHRTLKDAVSDMVQCHQIVEPASELSGNYRNLIDDWRQQNEQLFFSSN